MPVDVRHALGLATQRSADTCLVKERIDLSKLRRGWLQPGFRVIDRRVAGNARQTAREHRVVAMRVELRAECLRAAHIDLMHAIEVVVDLLEAAEVLQ